MLIDEQTIKDLEFDVLRSFLADECKSEKAKVNAARIKPFSSLADANRTNNNRRQAVFIKFILI